MLYNLKVRLKYEIIIIIIMISIIIIIIIIIIINKVYGGLVSISFPWHNSRFPIICSIWYFSYVNHLCPKPLEVPQ